MNLKKKKKKLNWSHIYWLKLWIETEYRRNENCQYNGPEVCLAMRVSLNRVLSSQQLNLMPKLQDNENPCQSPFTQSPGVFGWIPHLHFLLKNTKSHGYKGKAKARWQNKLAPSQAERGTYGHFMCWGGKKKAAVTKWLTNSTNKCREKNGQKRKKGRMTSCLPVHVFMDTIY